MDYTYNPTPFEGSTESHDAFKQWQLEKRAAPPSPPMRISLPFEGKLSNIALVLLCKCIDGTSVIFCAYQVWREDVQDCIWTAVCGLITC